VYVAARLFVQMSPGALVSFMLYQQSLSGAFSMMGDVFSALTAAVGAADKVRALKDLSCNVDAPYTQAMLKLAGFLVQC
jgi:ABC-type multidrug transport system fused ATPase/permease subunit